MKCPHCGTENPDNGVFCQQCDKWILAEVYTKPEDPAPEVPAEEPPAKKSNLKVIIPTIAAICAVILGVALLLPGPESPTPTTLPPLISTTIPIVPPTTTLPPEEFTVYETGLGHIQPFNKGGKIAFYSNGNSILTDQNYAFYIPKNFSLSLDGLTGAYLSDDGLLLYLRHDQILTIAENVLCYELSASGDGLVYMGEDRHLYLYDYASNTSTCFTTQISFYISKDFAISPDGKTVAFLVPSVNSATTPMALNWYLDGQITSTDAAFSNNAHIISVSNDASCVFMQEGLSLSVVTKDDIKTRLADTAATLSDHTAFVVLNTSHDQMLFYSFDGSHLATGSASDTMVANSQLLSLRPSILTQNTFTDRTWTDLEDLTQGLAYSYWHEVKLYSWLQDGSAALLKDGVSAVSMTANEQFIFMTNADGTLWRMDAESYETVFIAANVSKFAPQLDGSKVYYISENVLYCINGDGSGSAVRIADVAEKISMYVTREGRLYYLGGEQLYVCTPGGSHQSCLIGVDECIMGKDGRLYVQTTGGSTYVSKDNGELLFLSFDPSDTVPTNS